MCRPRQAWQAAVDSESQIDLDDDSLNVHFAYDDVDAHERHQVWFLDAVTILNQMRAARTLGIQTYALWRLGSEDNSVWKIWDHPMTSDPVKELAQVEPGYDVDTEGEGDILRVTRNPQSGRRIVTMDDDDTVPVDYRMITQESMDSFPLSYTVEQYGYHPNKVALSFDDGPDPEWTPKILDILKKYNVKGTFFMIGEIAEENIGVMRRVYREGHEIGNHTWTHPDISEISNRQVDLELNLTERLFASELGVQPLYFRPPYSIDQEPDTNDQAAPVERIQNLGYVIIGNKIDTNDWDEHPRKTPKEITDSVFQQIADMKTHPWNKGSVILLHDGGGDRSATIAALPVLIEALQARGYEIVPVSELVGKTRAEVMPPLTPRQRWQARADSVTFFFYSFFHYFVVGVFFVGDILMSGRLIIIGIFAIIDRLRKRKNYATPEYQPKVAVLIPAYNEEKVIVRTIRSVMMSNYKNIRIIVIDDGSKDNTFDVARDAYPADIASGRLTVLSKPNGGKADALNFALETVDEEMYVGIDADGVIAHDAITNLVPHFANPKIGAVAGNAKVGNRVNLWTRWQALEYITSQNFERRALDLFDVVMVVPGAIGAWRTSAVKTGGGYHSNTVAEDADLTMNLLEQGYSVIYEDRALAFTEAPVNADGLIRQRFRWSFGILQAVFKHKGAISKHRAMGLFALPNILIFQILLPLVSPLIDVMFVAGVIHYLIDKHFHPETASADSFYKLLTFFLAFLVIDFAASALAFALETETPGEQRRRLAAVPYLDPAVHLSAVVLGRAVQDGQAGDRRQAVQLGQAGTHRHDVQGDGKADRRRLASATQSNIRSEASNRVREKICQLESGIRCKENRMNSVKIVEDFWAAVWKSRNPDAIADFVVEDAIITTGGVEIKGRDKFIAWARDFLSKINDFGFEVVETFQNEDGSRVASLWRVTGKNNGMMGTVPDQQPISLTGTAIWSVREDGKLLHNRVERAAWETFLNLTSKKR